MDMTYRIDNEGYTQDCSECGEPMIFLNRTEFTTEWHCDTCNCDTLDCQFPGKGV